MVSVIVADIHHQYRMALAALEAGVHCLRLNPGNIRKPEHIRLVAAEARDRAAELAGDARDRATDLAKKAPINGRHNGRLRGLTDRIAA